jgi:hypothetical protein
MMTVDVDVWVRGTDVATTETLHDIEHDPKAWTDGDVRHLLEGMLRLLHRRKHPDAEPQQVALRGLSWIVNPYEGGGVVVAIEITMGAAVAGPFDLEQTTLERMVARVLSSRPADGRVH